MRKLKSETYKSEKIDFYRHDSEYDPKTGWCEEESYVAAIAHKNNVPIATGKDKAEAFKEAKRYVDKIQKKRLENQRKTNTNKRK